MEEDCQLIRSSQHGHAFHLTIHALPTARCFACEELVWTPISTTCVCLLCGVSAHRTCVTADVPHNKYCRPVGMKDQVADNSSFIDASTSCSTSSHRSEEKNKSTMKELGLEGELQSFDDRWHSVAAARSPAQEGTDSKRAMWGGVVVGGIVGYLLAGPAAAAITAVKASGASVATVSQIWQTSSLTSSTVSAGLGVSIGASAGGKLAKVSAGRYHSSDEEWRQLYQTALCNRKSWSKTENQAVSQYIEAMKAWKTAFDASATSPKTKGHRDARTKVNVSSNAHHHLVFHIASCPDHPFAKLNHSFAALFFSRHQKGLELSGFTYVHSEEKAGAVACGKVHDESSTSSHSTSSTLEEDLLAGAVAWIVHDAHIYCELMQNALVFLYPELRQTKARHHISSSTRATSKVGGVQGLERNAKAFSFILHTAIQKVVFTEIYGLTHSFIALSLEPLDSFLEKHVLTIRHRERIMLETLTLPSISDLDSAPSASAKNVLPWILVSLTLDGHVDSNNLGWMTPLRSKVDSMLNRGGREGRSPGLQKTLLWFEGEWTQIADICRPELENLENAVHPHNMASLRSACTCLKNMEKSVVPMEKMGYLRACIEFLSASTVQLDSIKLPKGQKPVILEPMEADTLLHFFACALVLSEIKRPFTELAFIVEFSGVENGHMGMDGYSITSFEAALNMIVIAAADTPSLGPRKDSMIRGAFDCVPQVPASSCNAASGPASGGLREEQKEM